jgi:hypothetical protein
LPAQPDFGDDSSRWANDGECDDPRFAGEGSADTLLDEDRGHDATDCRRLLKQGRIELRADEARGNARIWHGRLQSGDETLTTGEFVDRYEFEGSAGQHVSVDLRSSAFDTYLIMKDPAGEQLENDDAEDGSGVGHSNIEADLTEAGVYAVLVTSYESGESGAYSLTIDPSATRPRSPSTRDVTLLTAGAPVDGELTDAQGER